MPPLPFNPFPERPVWTIGPGRFVYDDSDIDYAELWRTRLAAEGDQQVGEPQSPPPVQLNGPDGPLMSELALGISNPDPNTVHIEALNLNPSSEYLLTDKTELRNDITDAWMPLLNFVAAAPAATIQSPNSGAQRFFRIWNLELYTGPVITLSAPSSGAVLSGKVKVAGAVSDILPARTAELYVDGEFHVAITDGPLEFELDTQRFGNGSHTLDVVVRSAQFGTDNFELASVASIPGVTFDNLLTSVDNAPIFSTDLGSPVFTFHTTGPADYRLDITDENQNLMRSYLGSTPGGDIQIAWDLLDQNGNPVPSEAGYTFTMTATSTGGGGPGQAPMPAASQVVIKSFAESPLMAGHAYLFYIKRTFVQMPREEVDRSLMNTIHGFIHLADLLGPDPTGTRTVLNEQVFLWQADTDEPTILNTIKRKDVGHVIYKGHGAASLIGSGDDTPFQGFINVSDLQSALQNNFSLNQGTYDFKNPKRYVEIDGCNTGEGDLPLGFGIPKFRIDGRPNIRRRSYVGWVGTITTAWFATPYTDHIQTQAANWHEPTEELTIAAAIIQAIAEHNFQIDPNQIKVIGSRRTTWARSIEQ